MEGLSPAKPWQPCSVDTVQKVPIPDSSHCCTDKPENIEKVELIYDPFRQTGRDFFMKRHLLETDEGVHTVMCDQAGQAFHSKYGSLQESRHVFIYNGLETTLSQVDRPAILEIGFGSGLNALLTLKHLTGVKQRADYTGVELYPLNMHMVSMLNFFNYIDRKYRPMFFEMHTCEWDAWRDIGHLRFRKMRMDVSKHLPDGNYDLIYYDAFSPDIQPELWTTELFKELYLIMNPGALFVTYCCKGEVQRCLANAGFNVEKCKGPQGKREMLKAKK